MRAGTSFFIVLLIVGNASGQPGERLFSLLGSSTYVSDGRTVFRIDLVNNDGVPINAAKEAKIGLGNETVNSLQASQDLADVGGLAVRVLMFEGYTNPIMTFGENDEGRYKESQIIAITSQQFYVDFNENLSFEPEIDLLMELDPEEMSLTTQLPLFPALGNDVSIGLEFLPGIDFFPSGQGPSGPATGDHTFDVRFELTLRDETIVTRNSVFLDNSQILPHVPLGSAGGATVTTEIIVNNPNPFASEGEVVFYGSDGGLREVTIDGVTSTRHSFSLGGLASQSLIPESSGPLNQGWAIGYGELPLQFSSVFTTFSASVAASSPSGEAGAFQGEAGISAGGVSQRHILRVIRDDSGFNTGFAIANVAGVEANLSLGLLDTEENLVASRNLQMEPKTQMAVFFSTFFELPDSPFSGTLIISSDTDVSVVSLKTLNLIQTSSLAGGTP